MVVAGTERELVMIDIFRTNTPLYLLQLLFKASRCITEALEDTTDSTHITVLPTHTILILAIGLTFILLRHCRHKQFIGISRDGKAVIFIHRNHQRGTQTHIGRQELALVITIKRNLTTDIRQVQANAQLTLTTAHHQIVVIVHRQIRSKGRGGFGVLSVVIAQIAVDPADGCRQ